ncbi:Bug family tripartite tricarboxylate transporter substrate binding protein [Xylophilus sp.]|uniref:Bug family tripartite tricarboxylate transporter substrate binding protein n=1 Tax=Xylophilus sp. TaxID=2653893 RepID=UPI0013BB6921|nr:tripartite tricarboxylate transporter substrate binding protein [Xylophilus sp.]KAF1050101.1 MAG: hypothetical protein GAK38_00126 [Xylophilus sp.]
MTSTSRRLLLACLFAFTLPAAHAAWPDRPIRFIVPAAAGGAPDIAARLFGDRLAAKLGQPVVIDNRPGAAGNIGMQAVATATPDGYTIAYGNNATLATNEFLFSKLPYDPARLVPVAQLTRAASLLVVNNDSPAKTVQDLVQLARQRPGAMSFGSGGTGTSGHVGAELFKHMAGIDAQHIPYKGAPQAINDLMAGRVEFLFDNVSSVGPHVAGGKLRALAVTTRERSPLFPDVPTMNEAGVKGFEMSAWGAIVAPPGTPAGIVQRINRIVNEAVQDPAFAAQVQKMGTNAVGGSPADLQRLIASERIKWGEVVRRSGAKVD